MSFQRRIKELRLLFEFKRVKAMSRGWVLYEVSTALQLGIESDVMRIDMEMRPATEMAVPGRTGSGHSAYRTTCSRPTQLGSFLHQRQKRGHNIS